MTDRKKLLTRLSSLVFFIFLVNLIALKFYWYYSIWYFDMPMHFLGSFWVGLVIIWLFFQEELSKKLIIKIILYVLIVGICWEIFEILVNNNIAQDSFSLFDTLSDLCFDLAGGVFAVVYFFKKAFSLKEQIRYN